MSPKKNPVRNTVAPNSGYSKKIFSDKSPKKLKISFSFTYWQQSENFGLGDQRNTWFVSLLQQLKVLSDKTLNEIFENPNEKSTFRFHSINWGQKNCPLTENEFWQLVPKEFQENNELAALQFQISKATGRVVGFRDPTTDSVFQIVLFDPKHNIQPSKDFQYKVDPTVPLECEYEIQRNQFLHIVEILDSEDCVEKKIEKIQKIIADLNLHLSSKAVLIDKEFYEIVSELMSKSEGYINCEQLLLRAFVALEEKLSNDE